MAEDVWTSWICKKDPVWSIRLAIMFKSFMGSTPRFGNWFRGSTNSNCHQVHNICDIAGQMWISHVSERLSYLIFTLLAFSNLLDPRFHSYVDGSLSYVQLSNSTLIHNHESSLLKGGLQHTGVQHILKMSVFRISRYEIRSIAHIPIWGLDSHKSESRSPRGNVPRKYMTC